MPQRGREVVQIPLPDLAAQPVSWMTPHTELLPQGFVDAPFPGASARARVAPLCRPARFRTRAVRL